MIVVCLCVYTYTWWHCRWWQATRQSFPFNVIVFFFFRKMLILFRVNKIKFYIAGCPTVPLLLFSFSLCVFSVLSELISWNEMAFSLPRSSPRSLHMYKTFSFSFILIYFLFFLFNVSRALCLSLCAQTITAMIARISVIFFPFIIIAAVAAIVWLLFFSLAVRDVHGMHIFMCMQIEELYERLSSERVQALSWNSGSCFLLIFQLHAERKQRLHQRQKRGRRKRKKNILFKVFSIIQRVVWKACVCASSYLLMHLPPPPSRSRYKHAQLLYMCSVSVIQKCVFSFAWVLFFPLSLHHRFYSCDWMRYTHKYSCTIQWMHIAHAPKTLNARICMSKTILVFNTYQNSIISDEKFVRANYVPMMCTDASKMKRKFAYEYVFSELFHQCIQCWCSTFYHDTKRTPHAQFCIFNIVATILIIRTFGLCISSSSH